MDSPGRGTCFRTQQLVLGNVLWQLGNVLWHLAPATHESGWLKRRTGMLAIIPTSQFSHLAGYFSMTCHDVIHLAYMGGISPPLLGLGNLRVLDPFYLAVLFQTI